MLLLHMYGGLEVVLTIGINQKYKGNRARIKPGSIHDFGNKHFLIRG